ncbi:hypothetical protein CTAYLR_006785 [Chrysophaeum taylorii]|uniref:Uncharacterized protein n=1 Tax=Chrysophaeum taylorii TaxID=2483200 RepID=A0AAD7U7K3_9STRA|nr:hypothetical protein CTAYLR_006785 [Chrysophaeum taylorii]
MICPPPALPFTLRIILLRNARTKMDTSCVTGTLRRVFDADCDQNNCVQLSYVIQSVADADLLDTIDVLKEQVGDCFQSLMTLSWQSPAQMSIERTYDGDGDDGSSQQLINEGWVDLAPSEVKAAYRWPCNNRKSSATGRK